MAQTVYRTPLQQIQKNKEDIAALQQGSTSEWEERVSEVLDYNETDTQVEIGTNLEVDGDIKINSLADLTDTDGDALIEANPTDSGTTTLTKLKVDDTIYNLSQGTTYSAGMGIDITNNEISVETSELSYDDLADKPTIPTVDQTYSASSTNAQSGVAVASAVSGKLDATKCTYQTTAPTAAITDGGVHIVYLSEEPSTKYDGYIYLIAEE